jgi:hypothetical protein
MGGSSTALTILHVAGIVFFAFGLLFLIIAIGLEEWSTDSGSTNSNPVGHVSVKHEVGLFRTKVQECCLTDGQVVPDFGTVCNLQSSHRGCATFYVTSAEYCEFVDEKERRAARGSMDCSEFEAGVILSAILAVCSVVVCVIVIGIVAFQVVHAGAICIASVALVLVSILVLIFMNILVHDNQVAWVQSRYQSSSALVEPSFSFALGMSYKIMAAALAMWAVAGVIAGAVWWARRRPEPKPEPRPIPRRPLQRRPEHIMTPAAAAPHPMSDMAPRQELSLPPCPNDLDCDQVDDFNHQLQCTHTCRLPFCTDTSAAHRRHFIHQ